MENIIMAVVGLVIAGLLIAFLGPVALNGMASATLANGTSASVTSTWGVLPLIAVVGFMLIVIGAAIKTFA